MTLVAREAQLFSDCHPALSFSLDVSTVSNGNNQDYEQAIPDGPRSNDLMAGNRYNDFCCLNRASQWTRRQVIQRFDLCAQALRHPLHPPRAPSGEGPEIVRVPASGELFPVHRDGVSYDKQLH